MDDAVLRALDQVVPERLLSRLVGHAARTKVPGFMLYPLLRWYVQHFQVDLSEAERPLEAYDSFVDFFTRKLRPGLRPHDTRTDTLISPVDGAVYASGPIHRDTFLLAKGHKYTVGELLGDVTQAEPFFDGSFLTIYLSPRDYHRIHAPGDALITRFQYVPGKLLPVNHASAAFFPKLFAENERLTTFMDLASGAKLALVKVGATNVGRIRLSYHPYVTNEWAVPRAFGHAHTFAEPVSVKRGQEVGMFEMGSTVVLLLSKGFSLVPLEVDQVMRLGQRIAVPEGEQGAALG